MINIRRSSTPTITLALALATLLVTSCSTDDKEKHNYRIPSKICGTKIKSKHTQNVLPTGNSVKEDVTPLGDGMVACEITVDDSRAFSVTRNSYEERETTESFWRLSLFKFLDEPKKKNLGPVNAIIGSNGSAVVYPCAHKKYQSIRLHLEMQSSNPASREDIQRFTQSFTRQDMNSKRCSQ